MPVSGQLNNQLSSDQWPAASMTTVTGDLSADGQPSDGPSFLGASSTVIDPDRASTTTKPHNSFLLDHRRGDDAPSVTGDDRRRSVNNVRCVVIICLPRRSNGDTVCRLAHCTPLPVVRVAYSRYLFAEINEDVFCRRVSSLHISHLRYVLLQHEL